MEAADLVNVPKPFNFKSVLGVCKGITSVEIIYRDDDTQTKPEWVTCYRGQEMAGVFYPTTKVRIIK